MSVAKDVQNAIRTIAEQAVTTAPFDKTRRGVVRAIDENTKTYTVHIDGVTYTNVKSSSGSAIHIGDVVSVIYPTNNTSQMVISGITDMTQDEIEEFVLSLGLHGRTICPYDVGDIYETTNSTNPSTKWDNTTWSLMSSEYDYIVEQGTSGIWTYRKWNSGIAECWVSAYGVGSTAMTTQEGYGYYAPLASYNFPTSFFNAIPSVHVTGDMLGALGGFSVSNTSSTGVAGYWWATRSVTKTCYLNIYAKGTWKEYAVPITTYKWRRLS